MVTVLLSKEKEQSIEHFSIYMNNDESHYGVNYDALINVCNCSFCISFVDSSKHGTNLTSQKACVSSVDNHYDEVRGNIY